MIRWSGQLLLWSPTTVGKVCGTLLVLSQPRDPASTLLASSLWSLAKILLDLAPLVSLKSPWSNSLRHTASTQLLSQKDSPLLPSCLVIMVRHCCTWAAKGEWIVYVFGLEAVFAVLQGSPCPCSCGRHVSTLGSGSQSSPQSHSHRHRRASPVSLHARIHDWAYPIHPLAQQSPSVRSLWGIYPSAWS